ncbi:MAG TPA: hypothetical protein VK283_12560 [Acidimicrobiales bacterium]|nr:hypothetical protein [Acidimicrobiales bacterium]
MTTVGRWLAAFGRFWLEFLFGDSLLLFPATLAIVGVAFALRHQRTAAIVVVPLLLVGLIAFAAYLGRQRAPRPGPGEGEGG